MGYYKGQQALITNVSEIVQLGGQRHYGMGDIEKGGQNGVGIRPLSVDGGTPQPFPPAIVCVIHEPSMWDYGYQILQRQHKSLWEQHAKTIDGIDFGYRMDEHSLPYGHDGQQYSMPLNNKRTEVSPSITMDEIYGNLSWNIHYLYMKHMCHPDTCASILSAVLDTGMPPWVWSAFTFSICVIQPDATSLYDRIIDAYCITNMWPTETGMLGVKKELGSTTVPQRTFNHKGVVTHNENTRELGRLIFAAMNYHRVNYDYATTFSGINGKIINSGATKTVYEALQDYKLFDGGGGALNTSADSIATQSMVKFTEEASKKNVETTRSRLTMVNTATEQGGLINMNIAQAKSEGETNNTVKSMSGSNLTTV